MAYPKLGTDRICVVCDQSFYKPPSNPAKACSHSCAVVLRRENAGRPKLASPQTCKVCREGFYKPLSHLTKWPAVTCSRACAAVLRWKDRIKRTCEHCGKEFLARHDQVAKGFGRYCSNACNGAADRRLVKTNCSYCNNDFMVPLMYKRKSRPLFCSMECWDAAPEGLRIKGIGLPYDSQPFKPHQRRKWIEANCGRCGSTEDLQLDHIVPRFMGGKNKRDNAQTLCRRCNLRKFWKEDLPLYTRLSKDSNVLA